jgi:hypothetical protein
MAEGNVTGQRGESTEKSGAAQPDGHADPTARGTRQKLSQRHRICTLGIIQTPAPLHERVTEIIPDANRHAKT